MSEVDDLFSSCQQGVMPKLHTVCMYGLDNFNPTGLLSIYKTAITEDKITKQEFLEHFNKNKLNELIFEKCRWVKSNYNYESFLQKGGIKSSCHLPQIECEHCMLCSFHTEEICSNCKNSLKK